MMYRICARVMHTKENAKGFTVYDVPTFYLDSTIQGIVDLAHAEKLAKEVCNPTNDPMLKVYIGVCEMWPNEV